MEDNHHPTTDELWTLIADKFTEILGPLDVEAEVDEEWRAKTDELAAQFLTDEWLYQKRRPCTDREVKIRTGVQVRQKVHKAPGGLIRAITEVRDGMIAAVSISGDFFFP
jgi:lipoate-protein ligase A